MDVRTAARGAERRPAVVICHGFKGFKDWGFLPKLAERLATAGLTAVSFNQSGSGVSGGDVVDQPDRFSHQRPSADLADVRTVVDWVVSEGAPGVGLVGHSRGGALAILHTASDSRIRGLVTWAAITDFLSWGPDVARWLREGRTDVANTRTGQVLPILTDALDDVEANRSGSLDVLAAAGRVRVPWLIIHGTGDAGVPVATASNLAHHSGSARGELLLLDGADHTFGIRHPWAESTVDFDQVMERTVGWLAAALHG